MKFGEIFHLGVVVADVDKAVKIYTEELGYGPFEIMDGGFFDNAIVNGEVGPGLPMKSAIYRSGTYEIELIEPTGPSIYMDFLKEKGPGVHHVILKSEEKLKDVVEMAERVSGRPPKLMIQMPDGTPIVAYADLEEEAGLLLEIGGDLKMPDGPPPEGGPGGFPGGPDGFPGGPGGPGFPGAQK